MFHIPTDLRRFVVERAQGRCEYCGIDQARQEATFHVDHVVPRVENGPTEAGNLALACVSCSLRKAARRLAVDPESGEAVLLFHPRTDVWSEHFRWEDVSLVGLTSTGRATVEALAMNRPLILAIRRDERQRDRHPPPIP